MQKQRIFFLDNLKSATIILVVLFHASLAYKMNAPEWWYVLDPKRVFAADVFHVWADVFIMAIMFFISGYFGLQSLTKQAQSTFWKKKWMRIGLPWIFGTFVLAPHVSYIMVASRGIEMPYVDFYLNLFLGVAYQQSQYWYLGALMALYLLLVIFSKLYPDLLKLSEKAKPSKILLYGLCIGGAVGIWLVNQVYPDDAWVNYAYILQLQPTRVPMYIIYFALGVYAYDKQWFMKDGYTPQVQTWLPIFAITSVLYVWTKIYLSGVIDAQLFMVLNAFMHSFFCLCSIFTLLAVFGSLFNDSNRFWAALSVTSYPIYYIHQNIVQELNWLVRPMETNAFVKYAIVCFISLGLCYLISRYLLLLIPPFRRQKKAKQLKISVVDSNGATESKT